MFLLRELTLKAIKIAFLSVVIAVLSGCMTPVSYQTDLRSPYRGPKINAVVVWNFGGATEKFQTIYSRMEAIANGLKVEAEKRGITASILKTEGKASNTKEEIAKALKEISAEHAFVLQTINVRHRTGGLGIEYYIYDVTLIHVPSNQLIWKTRVSANFYTSTDDMLKYLIEAMTKDQVI